jgi:hypothetical protein
MLVSMLLACFRRVMGCMAHVTMSDVSVIPGLLMVAGFMLSAGFPVVLCGRLMVVGGSGMMLGGLQLGCHDRLHASAVKWRVNEGRMAAAPITPPGFVPANRLPPRSQRSNRPVGATVS